ncbi:MAG: DUF4159 domain-containing protein [Phycisphaerales bacterium]|nr:DUF4159 domain-containing protein [Phycisphaerales bacterium]
MSRRWPLRTAAVCMVILLAMVASRHAVAAPAVSSQNVIAAIKRGVHFLVTQQHTDGSWEHGEFNWMQAAVGTNQMGGESALVTEALIDVSQSLHDPEISMFAPTMQKALKYVAALRTPSTYVASFQANALALLPNNSKRVYRDALNWDARYLRHSMHHDGAYTYSWNIQQGTHPRQPGHWDNSNTQYGVLGLWACAHAGLEVPLIAWERASEHWRRSQYMDGTWGYGGFADRPIKPTAARAWFFTPAGLASLFITDEFLRFKAVMHPLPDENVVRGMRAMATRFNPLEPDLYIMYGQTRTGLATGLQYLAGHNWYQWFASDLVKRQNTDGSWNANFSSLGWQDPKVPGWPHAIIGTAYALLVLDRGLNPVFINKLQYSKHYFGRWNVRPRDIANLTSWMVKTFEQPLNWQVVDINSPVSDWLDSPILYISGSHDPNFSAEQVAKLKAYVNAGGLILANCNGRSEFFKNAMIKYAQETVNNRYEVHKLSKASTLFHIQPWYHAASTYGLLGLSNGVRYLWIIAPNDFGRSWQNRTYAFRDNWELPANLYIYATGKVSLATKLDTLVVSGGGTPARSLTIAQVQYHGNWNPEPGAWPRMAQIASSAFATRLVNQNVAVDKLNAAATPLAHITGTEKFTFSGEQVAALRHYLNSGGMLLGDAAGGSINFTNSFSHLVSMLYPGKQLDNLPAHCTIYTGKMAGGMPATHVTYRKFYIEREGIHTTPEMLGLKIKGRWVVLFSQDDITSGLLGTNTWGISGYAPASAQALARNIICYAIAHK